MISMNFESFFKQLWFSNKEAEIFLWLYKLWNKPASTVAKHVNMERTYVYKTLRKMTKEGIISETQKWWITHFFIPDIWVLKRYISRKEQKLKKLDDNFSVIESEFSEYDQKRYAWAPKISLFDGVESIKNIYQDIYDTAIKNWYFVIKFFASNTFETQVSVNNTLKDYYQDIFEKLKKNKVNIETYLWNWVLIMEQISKTTNTDNLSNLPAGNSAINIFVVWESVYIIIFKQNPFGIKIDSEDLANTMHFMMENLKIS